MSQKVMASHIRKAAGGGAALAIAPAMFVGTGHVNPNYYLYD